MRRKLTIASVSITGKGIGRVLSVFVWTDGRPLPKVVDGGVWWAKKFASRVIMHPSDSLWRDRTMLPNSEQPTGSAKAVFGRGPAGEGSSR